MKNSSEWQYRGVSIIYKWKFMCVASINHCESKILPTTLLDDINAWSESLGIQRNTASNKKIRINALNAPSSPPRAILIILAGAKLFTRALPPVANNQQPSFTITRSKIKLIATMIH